MNLASISNFKASLSIKILCVIVLINGFDINVSAQDLPSPAANLQTLPLGSYVIPMDNTYQLNSGSDFNIKAYGLIVHLLHNDIKVKWAIKAGKLKDGIDFTVSTSQLYPTGVAGTASRNFKGGPFVISAPDTAGVGTLINSFYTANSLSGNNRPRVYQTQADVTVDIRYNLTGFKPKAAILNDGGNEDIHEAFMVTASMPAASYAISFGKDLLTGCYTFASEPHNDRSGLVVDSAIMGIRNFVLNGGNFLAQCAAVTNYENSTYGRFQTSTGITTSYVNIGSTLTYSNPDLSYSQFEGPFDGAGGVVDKWTINSAGINNQHNHATGSGANTSILVASVSKVSTTYMGGLAFYMGTHDFRTNRGDEVNGMRMFMNAFLTPSILSCSMSLLPFRLDDFSGSLKSKLAEVKWSGYSNEVIDHFELQKSTDGKKFSTVGSLTGRSKPGNQQYSYIDSTYIPSSPYYRLRFIQIGGASSYSKTILIHGEERTEDNLLVVGNPVHQNLCFTYMSPDNGSREIMIYNAHGFKVHSVNLNALKGKNTYSISLDSKLQKGMYFISLTSEKKQLISKFLKR